MAPAGCFVLSAAEGMRYSEIVPRAEFGYDARAIASHTKRKTHGKLV